MVRADIPEPSRLALLAWLGFYVVANTRATVDFGNTLGSATTAVNVAVTGARAGDWVEVASQAAAGINAGIVLHGKVTADDQVTLEASNVTAGALDPASAVYNILVKRPSGN